MSKIKEAIGGLKDKTLDKAIGGLLDAIGGIDLFDQFAEMAKTVMPLKATVEVKGKEALEVRAMIKEGSLFVKVSRIREPEKTEEEEKPEPVEEPTEEETEE